MGVSRENEKDGERIYGYWAPEEPKAHRPFSQASTHASTGYVHSSRLPIVDMRPYSRESSVVDKEIQVCFGSGKRREKVRGEIEKEDKGVRMGADFLSSI